MKKHMSRRILSLFLVLLLLLPMLVSCTTGAGPTETSASIPDTSGQGGSDSPTEEITTAAPETEPVYRDLFKDGQTAYKLIYPDDPSDRIANAMFGLQAAILNATDVEIECDSDFYNPFEDTLPETAYEILIGETNRVETKEAKALIREKDFIIYEKNGRIVILGGTEAKTLEAVEYFTSTYVNAETKNITILEGMQDISRYNYDLGVISIDGVNLMNYTIVIPEKAETLFPYFAALNLIDLLLTEAGVKLQYAFDTDGENPYEIVIGETIRPESVSAKQTSLQNDQYILKKVGNSIYMYGEDYMVGGAVSEFVNTYLIGANGGEENRIEVTGIPASNIAKTFRFPDKATSAILLIGDGMGKNHVTGTFLKREDRFLAEYLDNIGECTTYQYGNNEFSSSYTDSAASATALATGYKTKNSYLGVDQNNKKLLNVRELASSLGAKTGILTSDAITGATPAGFLCHHNSRKATSTLQSQINQLLKRGSSTYDKNLLFATSVQDNRNQLLPETRNMMYTLADEGETFFTMIEEAYIDKESHNNDLADAKTCVLRYNDIIGYCIQFVMLHPETALVITADHECGGLTLTGDKLQYTSGDHTNAKVPVYALGAGTEMFAGTKVDNTQIGKFLGSIYTDKQFGDPKLPN